MIYPLAGNGQATHHSMLSDPASQTSEPVLKPSFYSTFMDTTPTRPLIFSKPPSSLTPEKPSVITGGIQDKPKPIELKSPILVKEPKPTVTQSTSFYDWDGTWANLREEQTGARFAPSMTLLPLDKTVLTSGGILSPDPTKPIEPSTKQPVTKNTDPKNPQPPTTAITSEKAAALDAQTWLKEFGGSVTAPNLVGTDADIAEKFKIHAPLPTEIVEQHEVIELVRDKTPHRRSDGSIFNMLIPAAEASTGGYQDDWLSEEESLASPLFIKAPGEFCRKIYDVTDQFKFTSLVSGHENIFWNTLHAAARPTATLFDLTKDITWHSFENFDEMTAEQAIQRSETIARAIREAPGALKQSLYDTYSEFAASSPDKQRKMLLNAFSSFFIPMSLVEAYDSFKAGDIKGGLEITFEFAGSLPLYAVGAKGALTVGKTVQPIVSNSIVAAQRKGAAVLASYEFHWPVTFAFTPEFRLHSGVPIDLLKLQSPFAKKDKVYQHDYQKHQPKPGGFGAKWEGASINPIPDVKTGQRLLDTAYSTPTRPNQLFHYYEGKIIKFRTSNDGNWHAYEITHKMEKNVDDEILKKFRNDKLITNTEYKKLVKM